MRQCDQVGPGRTILLEAGREARLEAVPSGRAPGRLWFAASETHGIDSDDLKFLDRAGGPSAPRPTRTAERGIASESISVAALASRGPSSFGPKNSVAVGLRLDCCLRSRPAADSESILSLSISLIAVGTVRSESWLGVA
jgi:hypothetical protein